MFNRKRNTSKRSTSETMIGAGTKFGGVLESPANVYIDGEFMGDIDCEKTVVINLGALVEGTINSGCVVVHGDVVGNINALDRIEVGATGKIKGDVKSIAVRVAEGGILDGKCQIVTPGEVASAATINHPDDAA